MPLGNDFISLTPLQRPSAVVDSFLRMQPELVQVPLHQEPSCSLGLPRVALAEGSPLLACEVFSECMFIKFIWRIEIIIPTLEYCWDD